MESILVTGATGLLGRSLIPQLSTYGHKIITQAREKDADFLLDLVDENNVFELLNETKPSVIVNLIGLTSVEQCQKAPNEAYLSNVRTVENLSQWIKLSDSGTHLIQISTDQVYDGLGPHPEKAVNLTNAYACSKYAGELAADLVSSTVLRTNFVGISSADDRESLTDWVVNSLKSGQNIKVLNDVLFSPLSMTTLIKMIDLVIEQKPTGVFNLGSRNGMSKADFDFDFAECLGLQTKLMTRINTEQATFLKAYRPKDMRLDCAKFEKVFEVTLPNLSDEIQLVASEYRK
tara:strand:- start:137 stop:1006 length:870 start_codon:yes stop_codon:yes gene_type:complete